ncbi:MAG TPA: hypothetical protein VFF11_09320, partial [Candidatus Binatia bacterium]|nr:hypothetical protein [Candidatus Binatia bacterium]
MPEETPSSPETVEQTSAPVEPMDPIEQVEPEADVAGGFREPHPDAPAEFASHEADPVEAPAPEPAEEAPVASEPEPVRAP